MREESVIKEKNGTENRLKEKDGGGGRKEISELVEEK